MSILFEHSRKLDAHGEVADFWMLVEDDSIVATGTGSGPSATTVIDATGLWLVPGFIDLHSHGAGGHSYEDGPDAIRAAVRTHRAHGTTRSLISLVANPVPDLITSLRHIADITADDPLVLGSHLEGPFLSPRRSGAHNPIHLDEPSDPKIRQLLHASRGTLRQMTIAPELPGALAAIDLLVEAGLTVALGHTEATSEIAREAFDRGARILTHAFNAMPGIHHRAPGPVMAAFRDDRIVLELILDGQHVHPDIAALAFSEAPKRVALITDSMAAAGSADGDYALGTLDVTVTGGIARLRGTSTIAGSTLTQDAALRAAIQSAHVSPQAAVEALTLTPARALGMAHHHGLLSRGFKADAVLLTSAWHVVQVWADGSAVAPSP